MPRILVNECKQEVASFNPVPGRYRDLTDDDLVSLLKTLPRRPLLAGEATYACPLQAHRRSLRSRSRAFKSQSRSTAHPAPTFSNPLMNDSRGSCSTKRSASVLLMLSAFRRRE